MTELLMLIAKSTLIIVGAAVVVRLLRKSSASTRHIVWALSIGAVLLLPLFSLLLPNLPLALLKPSTQAASINPTVTAPAPYSVENAFKPSAESSPTEKPTAPKSTANTGSAALSPSLPVADEAARPIVPNSNLPRPNFGITELLLIAWTAGAMLVLVRFIAGLAIVRRAYRWSTEPAPRVDLIAADSAKATGLRRAVDVRVASTDSGIAVPITWGLWSPKVLLPAQSTDWSDDCIRAALLHEFAHIHRLDWVTMCLAQAACALYWFHPLVGYAAKQLREESERACDDNVIDAGVAPVDYAQRLVDVLRSMPSTMRPPAATIAMALPNETEGRIKAILAAGLDRRRIGARSAVAALAVCLAVALPLAAMRLTERKAYHVSGVSVELVGVSYDTQNRPWWTMDGKPANFGQPVVGGTWNARSTQGHIVRQFLFRSTGITANDDVKVVVPNSETSGSNGLPSDSNGFAEMASTADAASTDIRVGIASGPWTDLYIDRDPAHNFTVKMGRSTQAQLSAVSFSPSRQAGQPEYVMMYFCGPNIDKDIRVVAVGAGGTIAGITSILNSDHGYIFGTTSFQVHSARDVQTLKLQTRDYRWIDFPNVHLHSDADPITPAEARMGRAAMAVDQGMAAQRHGQTRDGIPYFRKAIAIDPACANAHFQLANALGNITSKTTITIHNGILHPMTMGFAVPKAASAEAYREMHKAAALAPSRGDWLWTLGMDEANAGHYLTAIADYRKAQKLLPQPIGTSTDTSLATIDPVSFHSSLAEALMKAGEYTSAVDEYRKALSYQHNNDPVVLGLGEALIGAGKIDEGRATLKKVDPMDYYYSNQAKTFLARYR